MQYVSPCEVAMWHSVGAHCWNLEVVDSSHVNDQNKVKKKSEVAMFCTYFLIW